MTPLQEAARKALELGKKYAKCLMMNQAPFDEALTALAQQGEPVAWAIYDKRGGSKSLHWAEQRTGVDAGMYNAVPLYKAAPAPQAQQGEPVAQARLGMKDGLAMALSVVELYGMKGDVIYREIAKLRDGIAPAPAPQAQDATLIDEGTKAAESALQSAQPEDGCAPNHMCNGHRVHIPTGECCNKCGATSW